MQSMRISDWFLNSYYLALLYGKEDKRDNNSSKLLLRKTRKLQKSKKLKECISGEEDKVFLERKQNAFSVKLQASSHG